MGKTVLVLGSFVADVSFRMARLPAWGETLMGSAFSMGPGGKGSNQAVAAARAGAHTQILTKLGDDAFGRLARDTWASAGVDASLAITGAVPTGAAAILIDQKRGENAIVVVPGACFTVTPTEIDAAADAVRSAKVVLSQLELPLDAVERGLRLARDAGVFTILNPAPAPLEPLPEAFLALADLLIPNETEAAQLTGLPVRTTREAAAAAVALQRRGARDVIVTLGERGALVCPLGEEPTPVQSFLAGACVDTTGAGDAFCGALAAVRAEEMSLTEAAWFASAAAGISVTRPGTAPSMPHRGEIEALLAQGRGGAPA